MFAIFIRVLLSWLPNLPQNKLIDLLYDATDPILKPFERFRIGGPAFALNLAPILAYFTLMIIQRLLPTIFGLFY